MVRPNPFHCVDLAFSLQETTEDEKCQESQASKAGSVAEPEDEPQGYELHEGVCEALYDMPPPSAEAAAGASSSEGEGDAQPVKGELSSSAGTFKVRISFAGAFAQDTKALTNELAPRPNDSLLAQVEKQLNEMNGDKSMVLEVCAFNIIG